MLPVDPVRTPVSLPASTPATAPEALTPAQQQALAERYAPILYFHPDEGNFLQDPNTFLEQSSLREERDFRGDREVYGRGDVPPDALADIGPDNADADAQLFLDHDNENLGDGIRAGDLDNSKNLYRYDAETNSITYYFFYAYNDGPPGGIGEAQNHEGDWERITVQLDDSFQPTEVRYSAHEGNNSERSWADAPLEDGRPVVYVGKGSHASYPEPGTWETDLSGVSDYASNDGTRFDLAGQDAVDVTTQPWYGSHVLWGERGSLNEIPSGLPWIGSASGITTGPTGPSPEKGPVGDGSDRQPIDAAEYPPEGPSLVDRLRDVLVPDYNGPLPDVPGLPDLGLPDLPDLPDIDLPDIDVPDIDLPDIDVPDIDIPDIDIPDPRDIDIPGI